MKRKIAKRACMVAYTFYDIDNRVRRYAETLVENGWQVDAVVLKNENGEGKRNIRGVDVIGLQKRKYDEKNKISYLFRLVCFFIHASLVLSKSSLKKPYSLIHVHSIPDFQVFAAIVPKIFGAKIILDIHDIVPELFMDKFSTKNEDLLFKCLLFVERISCNFADHVIIANHIWHERLIKRSVKPDRCTTLINYPDPKIFKERKTVRDDNKFVLCYPGTLSKHQGIETAINAVVKAKKYIPGIELHIYGKGSDEEYLKDHTYKLNASEFIFFKGVLDIEKIAMEMAQADVGVEPKLNGPFSGEAFSTKTLEFMIMRVPVIVSDTKVHKLYLPDDMVMYFPAGNSDALCEKIFAAYEKKRNYDSSAKITAFMQENNWVVKQGIYFNILRKLFKNQNKDLEVCTIKKN